MPSELDYKERDALVGGIVGFIYCLWSLANLKFEADSSRVIVSIVSLFDLINIYIPIGVVVGVAAGASTRSLHAALSHAPQVPFFGKSVYSPDDDRGSHDREKSAFVV